MEIAIIRILVKTINFYTVKESDYWGDDRLVFRYKNIENKLFTQTQMEGVSLDQSITNGRITMVMVETSDGNKYYTSDYKLPLDCYAYYDREIIFSHGLPKGHKLDREVSNMINNCKTNENIIHNNKACLPKGNKVVIAGTRFTYEQIMKLKKGDVVGYNKAKPFRLNLNRGSLYNGHIDIPLTRPQKAEWNLVNNRIRPLVKIPARDWHLLLTSLIGKYYDGTIFTEERTKNAVAKKKRIQKMVQKLQQTGECFKDRTFSAVAIGENLIFSPRNCGKKIFIVDSPLYGRGLYIFNEKSQAFDWASRRIDFRQAREQALAFIPHHGEWEGKAAQVLN